MDWVLVVRRALDCRPAIGEGMTRSFAALAICATFGGGACVRTPPPREPGFQVRESCPPKNDEYFYFPSAAISDKGDKDKQHRAALSRYLQALDSPSLSCGAAPVEGYRLVRLMTARATVILAARAGDNWTLESSQLERRDNNLWIVAAHSRRELGSDESKTLLDFLDKNAIWTAPTWMDAAAAASGSNTTPTDGFWTIEARKDRSYRAITRVNPTEDVFRATGAAFLALGKVE
jgi:hypothetical protein